MGVIGGEGREVGRREVGKRGGGGERWRVEDEKEGLPERPGMVTPLAPTTESMTP